MDAAASAAGDAADAAGYAAGYAAEQKLQIEELKKMLEDENDG